MFEKQQETSKTPEKQEGPEARIFFIRHSKATYKNYAEKLASSEPEIPLDIESQSLDLPPEGIELARAMARAKEKEMNTLLQRKWKERGYDFIPLENEGGSYQHTFIRKNLPPNLPQGKI